MEYPEFPNSEDYTPIDEILQGNLNVLIIPLIADEETNKLAELVNE